jgi:hypothetical protein
MLLGYFDMPCLVLFYFQQFRSPQNDDPASCSRFVSESESRLVVALVGCACNLAGSADGLRFIYVYPIGSDVTKSISNLVLSDLDNLPSLVQGKTNGGKIVFN